MDYEQLKIARLNNCDLYLHKNQYPYLGKCYAWALRKDADKITEMTISEMKELFEIIIPSWVSAIEDLYGPIRPNLSILGNEAPHLHAHLIPRFTNKRNFYGIEFIDPNPKGNYSPYPKKEISLEKLLEIKSEIIKKISF